MTIKRITTIILVLLVLAGLLFGVSWYMARRTAEQNGTTPLTFREFLGIGTPAVPGTPVDGELSGEFTDPSTTLEYDTNNNGVNDWLEDLNNNGVIDGNEDINNNGVLDGDEDDDNNGVPNRNEDIQGGSEITPTEPGGFDAEPYTPPGGGFGDTDQPGNGGNPDDDTQPGGSSGGGGTTTPPDDDNFGDVDDIPPPPVDITSNNFCIDEDMNIEFTTEELSRLRTLQNRFDAIANQLYEADAVEQQKTFYSTLKLQQIQVSELAQFCEDKSSGFSGKMKRRVPTPFYNSSGDVNTFTDNRISQSDYNSSSQGYRPIINNPIVITTLLERLLRINIW